MQLFNDCILDPDNPEAWFNRGISCMEKGDYSDAEICFRRAQALAPESLETILNLGYALDMQRRTEEALNCYEAVLAASPGNAKARYNRAIHLLRAGNLAAGFTDYEARFAAMKNADNRIYSQPRWDGSSLDGRSILVYCEQGLGDAIQFGRYIPCVAKLGGRVVLEVQQPLVSLLSTLSGVERVVVKSVTPPITDCHIPLLSLPHIFGTTLDTVPIPIPYLVPDLSKVTAWRQMLTSDTQFRVGLVWRGSASNPMDRDRSCPLAELAPLLAISGVSYYSLQVGFVADEIASFPQKTGLKDLTEHLDELSDTAALIANLDLVISVDTAVAHLAGAMGKPVWVMLAHVPDWRWMLERCDSPWYPAVRLFRQPRPGDWKSVVREIDQALRQQLLPQEHEPTVSAEMLEISFQRALASIEKNDSDSAIPELRNLLLHLPDDPSVWFNLGRAYDMAGQLAEAEHSYRRSLLQNPGSPAIWFALGEIRLKQKAYPEAEFCLRKAHGLKQDSVEILLSLGSALSAQSKTAEAFDTCQKILDIKPECVDALYNMSILQLRNGDYLSGFANFEARLAIEKFDVDSRIYRQPRWDGSSLNGKSILVYGEQGMGDVIQFARYIPLLAERGGKVVFEVDPPLIPLFESFPGVDRIVPKSKVPPLTDVYIQSLSLPYIFGTTMETVPNRIPYIIPDTAKAATWRQRLGNSPVFRVGLVWRGNPKNPRDKERSCSLSTFASLAGLLDVNFYSLQVGLAAAEAASPPEGMHLTDFSAHLSDLTETAALISNLDLLISVDTAVAHLAGAMGQQVWVVLPEGSEWRWLEGRGDTPWYPTMRIFEHERDSDWEGVVQRVRTALEKLLVEKANSDGRMNIETRYENGTRLKEAGDLEGAECCFRRIVEQHPELPDPQHSLGVVLQLQGRLQEAIKHYRNAIDLDPGLVKAHYNLANAFLRCGLYQDAIESAKTTIQCDPMHADAHWLLGMLLLQSGEFQNGWKEYEWRWLAKGFTSRIPELGRPLWGGTPLAGKTLLIHMEQGCGDMIQFIRYAPLAAALGGRVVVCALPELVSLLTTVEGVDLVVDRNGPLPEFDLHLPVQSLPHRFGTTMETIPCRTPYLWPDPIKTKEWRQRVAAERRFRIGLAWQGTPFHIDDRNRSCSLSKLQPLFDLEGVVFYSLQIGAGSEQLADCSSDVPIVDLTSHIQDFSDTAALVANLDLVISVDTAVAHLAGALDKQVWLMLPYVSEWRWMLEREDSPWYPTMRLFRQTSPGDWVGVIGAVQQALVQLLNGHGLSRMSGIDLLRSGDVAEAERVFAAAVAQKPDDAEALCNHGVALDALRRHDEAIACYHAALSQKPDYMQAVHNMGNTYISLDKLDHARRCYEYALELAPDFVPAHLALGEIGKCQLDFGLAYTHYQAASLIDPLSADAFQGLAEIHQAEEHYIEAIAAYRQALALEPSRVNALNMLGSVYQCLEQPEDAVNCYRQALALEPERATVLNNLGVTLIAQGQLDEAIAVLRHLIEIEAVYAEGHWNLSVALLADGHYKDGWQEFEWRFKKANPVPQRLFEQPRWDGAPLNGRTILLHAEQGFGDTFQFVRYVSLVVQRGGKVMIECQVPALKRLLLSLDGVAEVVVAGDPLPFFDCHLPLMSLPLLFGTTLETIPSHIPYLAAEPADVEIWQRRLGPSTKFRVGLVWFAKQSQVLNRKRSCPLRMFAPLWAVPGVEFHSLQIGSGTDQLQDFNSDFEINDLTRHIQDFADTAAYMANLDLVITIDTAVAHLSGALGIQTWVVLPHIAEWRWLSRRQDSPWYPNSRLFRQPSRGDWSALMGSVAEALSKCAQDHLNVRAMISASPRQIVATPDTARRSCDDIRVGLAWSGRQDNPLNRKRSCPVEALAPLFEVPNVTFVNLQLDAPDGVDARLLDLTEQIRDFEDTAALMANLDLVISIDTSVAHLAAASGRPTWLLLSHVADWRWLMGREDSPWYPGIQLFRQPDHGDWDRVVREVADHLAQLSGNRLEWHGTDRATGAWSGNSPERQLLEQQLESNLKIESLNASSPDAHLDVGASLALLGRYAEAAASFRHVLELNADHVSGHLNLAYSLLALGEYSEGWQHLEWRLHRIPTGQIPPWPMLRHEQLGTHPHGTSVLVHCEQGYGDTIQFTRFLPKLAEAGYLVIVSCQPPMASLVASIRGVSQVIQHGEQLPTCDLQVLLLSLPRLFDTTLETLPDQIPYFAPRQQRIDAWRYRLDKIVCRGENII